MLTRKQAAPYLACGDDPNELPGCTESDEHGPFDLLATIAGLAADEPSETLDITAGCIEGSAARPRRRQRPATRSAASTA